MYVPTYYTVLRTVRYCDSCLISMLSLSLSADLFQSSSLLAYICNPRIPPNPEDLLSNLPKSVLPLAQEWQIANLATPEISKCDKSLAENTKGSKMKAKVTPSPIQ